MNVVNVHIGTQIVADVQNPSPHAPHDAIVPNTIVDLLKLLEAGNTPGLPMLRTASGVLSAYLSTATDSLTIQAVFDGKDSFRKYLVGQKYAENSVRTYVNHAKILLNKAKALGWAPTDSVPFEWKPVLECAGKQTIKKNLIKFLVTMRPTPLEVTEEDTSRWSQSKIKDGVTASHASRTVNWLWQTLRKLELLGSDGLHHPTTYRVRVTDLPSRLRSDVQELRRWKQEEFSPGRPSNGQHRPITSKALQDTLCRFYGYAVHVKGQTGIKCLADLVTNELLTGFVGWRINERHNSGYAVRIALAMIRAALRHHPVHQNIDLSWFQRLLESVPLESDSVRKARREEKYVDYAVLEQIPEQIRLARLKLKRSPEKISHMVMEQLLMSWLLILPWRQRNIRECRVSGPEPNLFKSAIAPSSQITKPAWVLEEEQRKPAAQFWQFRFKPIETKTGTPIHALLPKQLVPLLEEYHSEHRPHLLRGKHCDTLFLNRRGGPIDAIIMSQLVRELTLRYAGRQVTPHRYRDILAYAWLNDHPDDYLRLSKLLWHRNINTTIRIYGARFNESSGVAAMESWLEEREKGHK